MNKNRTNETDIRWLVVGALAGLLAAGYGILQRSPSAVALPADAVASVNEILIGRDVYERTLVQLAVSAADDAGRAQVVERLIDEELLVQRGIELGMTESASEVRAAITNALVASVTAEADAASPDDAELKKYLADNAERFSYTSRLSVEAWETETESVAQQFVTSLQLGETPPLTSGVRAMSDLPAGMLPTETVRDFLGPAITAAAAEMPDGSSAVFARRGRWLVVRVVARENAYVTDLEPIRNRVLLDYRRNLANESLQSYLDELRQRADIRLNTP